MVRRVRSWVILWASLALLASVGWAERYRFRHFGPEDGLATTVSCLLRDRTGFLWVGTGNGLFRYDGAHFQRFGVEEGLPNASMRAVKEAPDGTIWVLTGRGPARYRRTAFEKIGVGVPLPEPYTLEIDEDGRVYIGYGKGLLSLLPVGGETRLEFTPVAGTPRETVNGILAEHGRKLWFGCGLHLCLLESGRLRTFDELAGLPQDRWQAMLRDRTGAFWVRGPRHLFCLPPGGERFVVRDHDLPQSSNSGMSVIQDRQGQILVSTDRGLARLIGGRWQLTGMAQGLESDAVSAVLEDREGSLWIGLWGAGLARWPGSHEWTNWTALDGLSNNIVWSVLRHPSGATWLGTDRGLVRLQDGSPARVWTQREGLAGDKVKSLVLGSDGIIWAGSLPGGVSRIDPRTGGIRTYGVEAGLEDDRVIALHLDRDNRLWASTSEALYRTDSLASGMRFERMSPPGTADGTMYFRFHSDRQGRVWVGSVDGLFRFDHGSWTRFTTSDGLRTNAITHITETPDGAIWASYREPTGMARLTFPGGVLHAEHFGQREGLPSEYVIFLGVDSRGRLWTGTDNGVAVRSGDKWRVYTHEDGLVWDDCAANSFLAEPDGTVWIGTLKGVSRFHPDGPIVEIPAPPPPVITGIRFGNRSADPTAAGLQIPFADRNFLVTFAGLSLVRERNMRFRYRLTGLDDHWVESALREARYSSLPPGGYRFEVMARNAGGPWWWSPAAAAISFAVVPPWWATWWFRGLAIALIGLAVTGGVRVRMRRIQRENRRLETAVRERTGELELQKELVERQNEEIEGLLHKAQEVSRLKSEFLANMSHEIRTPMNGVIGMTQLVLNTTLDGEQRQYLGAVRDSAESLLVVINDILDFSKIEAGKMELSNSPFDLRKCVADSMAMFIWKAQEKGVAFSMNWNPGTPAAVTGDSDRLRQILLNLIGNAMKFTERGEIVVSVAPEPGRPRMVHFEVRDTGSGIAADKQAVIFEAFAQADGSSRRRQGGTGLGLAICSKLVRLMDGKIWVESAPGAGSTFHFTACLRPVEALPHTSPENQPAGVTLSNAGQPLRILLAEDNPVNQKLARFAIEKMGHSIVMVNNGLRAVETSATGGFDLILMDLQMPEMDGFEATARIREAERSAGRHTPIVAMTAHAMHGDREQCLRAGMDDYISKPIDLHALARMIDRYRVSRPAPATID